MSRIHASASRYTPASSDKRERLADAPPQMVADRVHVGHQRAVPAAVSALGLDAAVALLPLLTGALGGHAGGCYGVQQRDGQSGCGNSATIRSPSS